MSTHVSRAAEQFGGAQFRTDEVKTQLVDPVNGRPIYRKAVVIPALPNIATGTFAHGITGINVTATGWCVIGGFVEDGAGNANHIAVIPQLTELYVDTTNINITTTADLSGSSAVVFLEYTKV